MPRIARRSDSKRGDGGSARARRSGDAAVRRIAACRSTLAVTGLEKYGHVHCWPAALSSASTATTAVARYRPSAAAATSAASTPQPRSFAVTQTKRGNCAPSQ